MVSLGLAWDTVVSKSSCILVTKMITVAISVAWCKQRTMRLFSVSHFARWSCDVRQVELWCSPGGAVMFAKWSCGMKWVNWGENVLWTIWVKSGCGSFLAKMGCFGLICVKKGCGLFLDTMGWNGWFGVKLCYGRFGLKVVMNCEVSTVILVGSWP